MKITIEEKEMLVDIEVKNLIGNRSIRLNHKGYAKVQFKGKDTFIHHLVLGKKKGFQIDHINGNRLDNRASNLRFVTQNQNQHNRKINKNSTTGFKGVSFVSKKGKFMASICVNNKSIGLGLFTDKTAAAKAYNEAAKKYFGEYSLLNKI